MKKQYTGLRAEKVSIEVNNDIIVASIPSTCFQIVANTVLEGTQVCSNPSDTTLHRWYGNNPYDD